MKGDYSIPSENYLTVHIDDIFIPNSSYSDPSRDVIMTKEDFIYFANWARVRNFRPSLLFNGYGENTIEGKTLIDTVMSSGIAFLFEWINHTYEHINLDNASFEIIYNEIYRNLSFASRYKLTGFDRFVLVTGEHSGLNNPQLIAAARRFRIINIGDDASVNLSSRSL